MTRKHAATGEPAAVRARLLGLLVAGAGLLTLASTLGQPWRAGTLLAELVFTVTGTQLAHTARRCWSEPHWWSLVAGWCSGAGSPSMPR